MSLWFRQSTRSKVGLGTPHSQLALLKDSRQTEFESIFIGIIMSMPSRLSFFGLGGVNVLDALKVYAVLKFCKCLQI